MRRAIGRNRAALLAALGSPPDVASVPDALWAKIEADIADDTKRLLIAFFLLAQSEMGSVTDRLIDPDAAGLAAADYASRRASELGKDLTSTLRDRVTTAAEEARTGLERGESSSKTTAQLGTRIQEIATKQAESTGVTETTAANSAGEIEFKRQHKKETGIVLLGAWSASLDSKTCKVCRGLDGTDEEIWGEKYPEGPPAHVQCRCFILWSPATPGPDDP